MRHIRTWGDMAIRTVYVSFRCVQDSIGNQDSRIKSSGSDFLTWSWVFPKRENQCKILENQILKTSNAILATWILNSYRRMGSIENLQTRSRVNLGSGAAMSPQPDRQDAGHGFLRTAILFWVVVLLLVVWWGYDPMTPCPPCCFCGVLIFCFFRVCWCWWNA